MRMLSGRKLHSKDIFLFLVFMIPFRRRENVSSQKGKTEISNNNTPPWGWKRRETSHGGKSTPEEELLCLATTPIKSKYVRVPYQKRKRNFSKNFYNNCEDNTSMYQDRRGRLSLSSGQVGRKIGTKENSIMALPERKNKKKTRRGSGVVVGGNVDE